MQKIRNISCILALLVLVTFNSCGPENDNNYLMVNQWVSDVMTDYYYWYQHIPTSKKPSAEINPEDYFNSLLYTPEDKWSFIVDDYQRFKSEMVGSTSGMGISPAFGRFAGTDNVFILVEFVYKNSPAEKAGLRRGDFILKINDRKLTIENYYQLYSGQKYTVTLGEYTNQGIRETNTKIALTAQEMDINPVVIDSIYTVDNTKVGYVVISEFQDYEAFRAKVKPTFDRFKSQNVSQLIVDLRYNRGGEQNAAIWLASVLAPQVNVSEPSLIIQLSFNDKLQPFMEVEGEVEYPFNSTPGVNFNLEEVYFLTGRATASASELVIVGLEPYMNVIQIGENTAGKYTGMWVIPDLQEPARHNWAMMPIVMKYANARGKTDFKTGLVPDYPVTDQLELGYPLGDLRDNVLNAAVYAISGKKSEATATNKKSTFDYISLPNPDLKDNLLIMPK